MKLFTESMLFLIESFTIFLNKLDRVEVDLPKEKYLLTLSQSGSVKFETSTDRLVDNQKSRVIVATT